MNKERMTQQIPPETITQWREALKDPVARARLKNTLMLHQDSGLLSPDLNILAAIYDEAPNLQLQQRLIDEL